MEHSINKRFGDIDIDVGNKDQLLDIIDHVPASMLNVKPIRRHPTGIYVTDIPYDPTLDMASIDYEDAERRGYFKIDILNVHVYSNVIDEQHLYELMKEPNWKNFNNRFFVEKLIHLSNHYHVIRQLAEPVDSIPRLAMLLALIRPGKKHLIGKSWSEISKTIWDKGTDGYQFKRSHACAYSHLVVIHANLLSECYQKTGTYDLAQLKTVQYN